MNFMFSGRFKRYKEVEKGFIVDAYTYVGGNIKYEWYSMYVPKNKYTERVIPKLPEKALISATGRMYQSESKEINEKTGKPIIRTNLQASHIEVLDYIDFNSNTKTDAKNDEDVPF